MSKLYVTDDNGRYRVEVIADRSKIWYGNQLRFSDVANAAEYARELSSRWYAVSAWRVIDADGLVHQTEGM